VSVDISLFSVNAECGGGVDYAQIGGFAYNAPLVQALNVPLQFVQALL